MGSNYYIQRKNHYEELNKNFADIEIFYDYSMNIHDWESYSKLIYDESIQKIISNITGYDLENNDISYYLESSVDWLYEIIENNVIADLLVELNLLRF